MSSPKPYYDAEESVNFMLTNGGTVEAFGSTFTLPIEAKFTGQEEIQRYVDRVCEHCDLGDPPPVKTMRKQSAAIYSNRDRTIYIPERTPDDKAWAMREMIVLHELAHHMSIGNSHGSVWAGCFIELVTRCIGYEVGFLLMAEFSERGVQITPYRVK